MNPWKEKVLAFNRAAAVKGEKASDLEKLIAAMAQLPPGQLKKILTDEIIRIFEKYGVDFSD